MPLSEAVKALEKQTGNTIADRRKNLRDNPKLKLDLKDATFWQALDDITAASNCSYSLYEDDGVLALVDGPPRKHNAAYAGICRLAVKRVSLVRFDETGLRYCNVVTELAWEPRFQPIYVDIGAVDAAFTVMGKPHLIKIVGPGKTTVEKGIAMEVEEIRLPDPPRAASAIDSLSVEFKLTGPAKMLTFRLADLKAVKEPVQQIQDDVKVTFKPLLPQSRERWSFNVTVFNPPGSQRFESHEFRDWLVHNRIYLEKVEGGKTITIPHKPEEEQPANRDDPAPYAFKRAAIRYDFTGEMPAKTAGWSLVYRTPGRIVDVPLKFTLTNIVLP